MPTVSIIVPVYNVAPYLEECLRSIARQSFDDFECIVVDDGSTDGSGEMCDSWSASDPRFRVIHQENRGLSAARNAGLDIATGEYVQFVDSDDWVEPNYTEALLRYAKRSGCPCVICGYARQTPHGWVNSRPSTHPTVVSARDCLELFLQQTRYSTCRISATVWSRMYRRSLFEDNAIRFPEGRVYEDIHVLFPTIYHSISVALVPDVLYCKRQREGSITGTQTLQNLADHVEAYLRLEHDIAGQYPNLLLLARVHTERIRVFCLYQLRTTIVDIRGAESDTLQEHDTLRQTLHRDALSHWHDLRMPSDVYYAMALLLAAVSPATADKLNRFRHTLRGDTA